MKWCVAAFKTAITCSKDRLTPREEEQLSYFADIDLLSVLKCFQDSESTIAYWKSCDQNEEQVSEDQWLTQNIVIDFYIVASHTL